MRPRQARRRLREWDGDDDEEEEAGAKAAQDEAIAKAVRRYTRFAEAAAPREFRCPRPRCGCCCLFRWCCSGLGCLCDTCCCIGFTIVVAVAAFAAFYFYFGAGATLRPVLSLFSKLPKA